MARSLQNSFQQSASIAGHVRLYVTLLLTGMIASLLSGCQQGPGGMAMRQYQQDSDRLLSEFRAQKKRAEELEARNAQLEQRLAESEKLLALGPSPKGNSRSRSSSNRSLGEAVDSRRAGITLSERDSTRSNLSRNPNKSGLPDVTPGTPGRFTSGLNSAGNNLDPISLGGSGEDLRGDSSRESQWRPISKPNR
jgi:hypothetical protein